MQRRFILRFLLFITVCLIVGGPIILTQNAAPPFGCTRMITALQAHDSVLAIGRWQPQGNQPVPPRVADLSPQAIRIRAREFIRRRPRCNLATCEYCCLVTAMYVLTEQEMSFAQSLRVREIPESPRIDSGEVYLFILDFKITNNRGLPHFHSGVYYPNSEKVHSRVGNRWKTVGLKTYRRMAEKKGYSMHFHLW